ncbi:MAG: undecaprenyldiphospho-muramoylpentapeptide beta-N-acetylglucosaminyltransferase [Myxococcales bacterium]|nr:undecaprenyldiphospho-muramoylpentapeptide beta-N-acetylglucosaminyltransferase [Myxococcales bacterium]USN51300.1 MAG: undecaprenyldiphospho-muramoylpentapeptide beta-N-acetylglucosaminyltransferase [Myxococcales bacterium]
MHIIVTGGGTGGHIFPALEIAKEFINTDARTKITYVGNSGGIEERMAKNCGFQFFGIKAKKLVGQSFFAQLKALFVLTLAVLKCAWFLLLHRPHAVIGVGGYVSAPMIIASFILRIDRSICEQNVVPGLANRLLAHISNRVFASFVESKKHFPKHTIVTGNPIRKQFFSIEHGAPEKGLKILVTGGTLGAQFLNREIPKALKLLQEHNPDIKVTHQTGKTQVNEVAAHYKEAHIEAQVTQFIDNMPESFKRHDLLISRAGATVSSEIMASGMPSILVPYRFANAHQRENALALVKKGAALLLEEGDNFAAELSLKIKNLYDHPEQLKAISENAKHLATPHAASSIVKTITSNL